MTGDERTTITSTIEKITGKVPTVRWCKPNSADGFWIAESGQEPGDFVAEAATVDLAYLTLLRAAVSAQPAGATPDR